MSTALFLYKMKLNAEILPAGPPGAPPAEPPGGGGGAYSARKSAGEPADLRNQLVDAD